MRHEWTIILLKPLVLGTSCHSESNLTLMHILALRFRESVLGEIHCLLKTTQTFCYCYCRHTHRQQTKTHIHTTPPSKTNKNRHYSEKHFL
jgi:hypothetical protein